MLTIGLFTDSQVQFACLLYPFQRPWLSCAAKELCETTWKILLL